MERRTIAIDRILVNLDRQEGGMGEIDSLAASMGRNGLINPITVLHLPGLEIPDGQKTTDDEYEIVAGRRRLEAAKVLGWTEIPATIYSYGEAREEEVQLAENVNRLDMHPLDEAVLYKRLIDSGSSLVEISKLAGRSKSAVYQRVELLRLIPAMKDRFRSGDLSMTQASMIGALSSEAQGKIEAHFAESQHLMNRAGTPCPSWIFSQAFARFGGIQLPPGGFPGCDVCNNRTRFSDASLFPELTNEPDQCLDRECFREMYARWVVSEVEAYYRSSGVTFSEIAEAPALIEHEDETVLYSPGAFLTIGGIRFPVINSSDLIIIEDEEREEYADILRAVGDKAARGFYIETSPVLSLEFVCYVRDEDLKTAHYEDPDDESEETIVPVKGYKERSAYRDVMKDAWNIERLVKSQVISQIVLEHFDIPVTPLLFKRMIERSVSKADLVATIQAHQDGLEDKDIIDSHRWIEGHSFEWMKTVAYNLLMRSAFSSLHFDFNRPVDITTIQFFDGIGIAAEEVFERCKTAYQEEVQRRFDRLLGDAEEEAEDSETFSHDGESEEDQAEH